VTGRRGWVWIFPALGFAVVGLTALPPGSPVNPNGWGVRGPFGAFTWTAWFVSSGLGVTLLLLAVAARARCGADAGARVWARIAPSALAFGLLALASYAAAATADRIERNPVFALMLALAGVIAVRALAARVRFR
jgi:hypothetical protein